jgi:hypothetical protein
MNRCYVIFKEHMPIIENIQEDLDYVLYLVTLYKPGIIYEGDQKFCVKRLLDNNEEQLLINELACLGYLDVEVDRCEAK